MHKDHALKAVAGISVAGMLFSGYLSFTELTSGVCAVGGCSVLMGIPTCVYGFVMYALVFGVAMLGLR